MTATAPAAAAVEATADAAAEVVQSPKLFVYALGVTVAAVVVAYMVRRFGAQLRDALDPDDPLGLDVEAEAARAVLVDDEGQVVEHDAITGY